MSDYPFEYKEVEKKYAEVGMLPYKSKGMRFVKFIYIKVSDVIHDFKNPARADAIKEEDVTLIENIIRAGMYRGWGFVPPVVNEKGELIAGHHRLEGHIGEDQEYMWVALCAFDDAKAEFDYNVLENQMEDTYQKKKSSNKDLINSTLHGINEGHVDKDDLKNYVKKFKKPDSDKRIILETIQKKLGIKIDAHRPLSRQKITSEYATETNGKNIDHQANLAVGDNIFNNARVLNALFDKLIEGQNPNVVYKINDTVDLEHLNEERERLRRELSKEFLYFNFVKPFAEAFENGTMGNPNLNFPKQYESDSWKLDVETSYE